VLYAQCYFYLDSFGGSGKAFSEGNCKRKKVESYTLKTVFYEISIGE